MSRCMIKCRNLFLLLRRNSNEMHTKVYASQLLNHNIKGRDFLNISDFSTNELKLIIWTAMDLKTRFNDCISQVNEDAKGILLTSLLCAPCVKNHVNIQKASQLIGGNSCIIVDNNWESATDPADTGRILSVMSNIVLASASHSSNSVYELAGGSSVPVINLGCPQSSPLISLGYAVTILGNFKRLERLRVAWVGPSDNPILASLLLLMPRLRMHLYVATEDCNVPPNLDAALKLASTHRSEIHHVSRPEDAIYRSDVIITSSHSFNELHITKKFVDEAALKWIFLHDLPRTRCEVADDVFHHKKQSFVWKSMENQMWTLLAVMLRVLTDYVPATPEPSFSEDGP